MKDIKKMVALLITMVMVLGMSVTVFAGQLGNGTITVENATKGQTYTAYRIFNATYAGGDGVSYKVPAAKADSVSTTLFDVGDTAETIDGVEYFSVTPKSTATDKQITDWAKANYSAFDDAGTVGTYGADGKVTFSDLPYGYYYISSSLGSVVTIDTAHPDATVKDKNTGGPNTPAKKITAENGTSMTAATSNDAAVGSVERFQVTYNATNWVTSATEASTGKVDATATKVECYTITDTPTGLAIDSDSVVVTVNGTAVYENGASVDDTYKTTVSKDAATGVLTVVIPWVDAEGASLYAAPAGNVDIPVVVSYDAVVTSEAASAVAPNSVEITYNNDGNVTPAGRPVQTYTYTYKFQLDKVKEDGTALLGAKFRLYAGDSIAAGDAPLNFRLENGTYICDPNGTETEIDLTETDHAVITGLDKQAYTLRETLAPSGYNKADDMTLTSEDLVRVDGTIADGENVYSNGEVTTPNDRGVATVVNKQGSVLPSTGGTGTTVLYVTGALLVLCAGVAIAARRRAKEE